MVRQGERWILTCINLPKNDFIVLPKYMTPGYGIPSQHVNINKKVNMGRFDDEKIR